MHLDERKNFLSAVKKTSLLLILFAIVLGVNASVISFNLMYPEQPSIYVANQTITSFSDLIQIYLHPKLLQANVSFFRPSGHFLIYQLMVPFIGWHNTQDMFIVNFIFLTLIGYFLVQLYSLLFPTYKIGGYIAFSIYLMHPALSLARFTLMHFEFAYVFFLTLSLYLFARFCQLQFKSYTYFIASLMFYIIAVTFKEPALMLGPVLMCYFWIYLYDKSPVLDFLKNNFSNLQRVIIMTLITVTSIFLGLYMLSAWPVLTYATKYMNFYHTLGTINAFLQDVFAVTDNYIKAGFIVFPDLAWRTLVFPPITRLIIWGLCWITLLATAHIFLSRTSNNFINKKSLFFLWIAAAIFLILPFSWGMGGPWHYSLTILFLSLAAGFSFEYACGLFIRYKFVVHGIGLLMAIGIAATAIQVNHVNIQKYALLEKGPLGLALNHNAISNPPNIKEKLNADSILVIEDSILHNDYMLGNSAYPFFLFLSEGEYDVIVQRHQMYFLRFHHTYSGNLFRYAYLMPHLREETFPFQVDKMNEVANEILYTWLQQPDNIFCLGYDVRGNWIDKTALFRNNILKEKSDRGLQVNAYYAQPIDRLSAQIKNSQTLTVPDTKLCQFTCDQDQLCKGFIYADKTRQCHFYSAKYALGNEPCIDCQQFRKDETHAS